MQDKFKEDPRYQALGSLDRLKVFEDYMKELTALDKEAKLAERERQKKKEKKQRENFRVRSSFCVLLLECSLVLAIFPPFGVLGGPQGV